MKVERLWLAGAFLSLSAAFAGCGAETTVQFQPTSTPGSPLSVPTATALPGTPTNTPAGTPTNTPAGTPTNTPAGTPTNTPVGTPTNTPAGTPTNTPAGTPTNTPMGTATNPPSAAPTARPSVTPVSMPTLGGPTGGGTPAASPVPTPTKTPIPPGVTPTPTPTPTPSPSPVATITHTSLPAGPKIYVANHGKEGASPSVTIYAQAATGNAAPLATLSGSKTNQQQIQFPGVDSSGNLYLSDAGTASSSTSGFAAYFSATGQSGNQPASFEISGLANPEGIAFDSGGNVYVAAAGEIFVYPPHPTSKSAPKRTLTGDFTFGEDIYGIAIDASNRLYVTLANEVEVYGAGASGNVAPIQEFDEQADASAGLDSCLGIAVDTSNNIYCANFNNSTITEYAAGSTGTSVTPMVTATDATLTSIDEPFGIFVDATGNVYVANYGNSSISIFANASLGAGTATRRITGAATGLHSPYGLYVR